MATNLKIDFATHDAAKYAVVHWHYSRVMPAGKIVRIGVWEDEQFKGVVLFSSGTRGFKQYGLTQEGYCELTRVALRDHATPVTRIIRIALKLLKQACPGLRLVVSYADANQGHVGGIYQGGNWIYEGEFAENQGIRLRGKVRHSRTIGEIYGTASISWLRANIDPKAEHVRGKPKFKYLMALDRDMREEVAKRSKPYPKAAEA